MASPPKVRFSNPSVTSSDKALPWELPVPVCPFWDTIKYCYATAFLGSFSASELASLPIDPNSNPPNNEKWALLLSLLQAKLSSSPADLDFQSWYDLNLGVSCFQEELNLPEAEDTFKEMVRRSEGHRPVEIAEHCLADYYVRVGRFEEGEAIERRVVAWMDSRPHLGPGTPQAINGRRIIARALWGQERREEAEALMREIEKLTEEMEGKWAVYKEEEERLNEVMRAKLAVGDYTGVE
ncbi:hypothetical protein OQA88_4595 [Cercophora sp. LCS_1]